MNLSRNSWAIALSALVSAPWALAQTGGFTSSAGGSARPASTAEPTFLPQFRYTPAASDAGAEQKDAPKRSALGSQITQLNAKGDYQQAGTLGQQLLASEKPDPELQLFIANSLAWTGRLAPAAGAYQGLIGSPFDVDARVGLANIDRWRGRDDLALPVYQSVLAKQPENEAALEGLAMAQRELAPKTTVRAFTANDSSNLHRGLGSVAHRWRGAGGADTYEVEFSGFRDTLEPVISVQKDLSFRYESRALPLKPSLELNLSTQLNPRLYGQAAVKVFDDAVTLKAGHINWGKDAANPKAEYAALSANTLGLRAEQALSVGKLSERLDTYAVSDGNTLITIGINLDLAWRPLGERVKPFVGLETRGAQFNTGNYWSPVDGYGAAYAGVMLEWGGADWNLFVSGQLGRRLYGEAGSSWSLTAGGKYWMAKDVALGFNAWKMSSWRDNTDYRAHSADVYLEKLWP